jgi:hypothetical protein
MENTTSEVTFKNQISKISNRSLFLLSLGLIILNSVFIIILSKRMGVHNLDGTYSEANTLATIISGLMGIIFSFPVLCLFLAFITTIFINKNQPYKKRYLRGYLFTLLILNIVIVIRFAYNILAG